MIGYKFIENADGTFTVVLVSMGNHEELLRSVDDVYTRVENADHLVELLRKAGLDLVHIDDDKTIDVNGPDAEMEDLDGQS